jgi:two-component system, chemotaxis family, CheB/CheR fusion protein
VTRKRKSARPVLPPPKTSSESGEKPGKPSFPIVGIGASAGGLEAFKQLLHALPVDTGMGFVLVQHLSPTHASNLAEILSRSTRMTVMEVQDESRVRPNHVFVIPPDRNMIISGGTLQLVPRESSGLHRSIDYFFRSLGIRATKQSVWFYPPDAAR